MFNISLEIFSQHLNKNGIVFCWTFFPLGIIILFICKSSPSRSIYFEAEKETSFLDNFLLDLFFFSRCTKYSFPTKFLQKQKTYKKFNATKNDMVSNSLNISEDCFGRDEKTFKLVLSAPLMYQIQLLRQYCLETTMTLIYMSFCFPFANINFMA